MATKKTSKKSGLNAPTVGTVQPKGTTVKKLPNGRIVLVPPEKKKK